LLIGVLANTEPELDNSYSVTLVAYTDPAGSLTAIGLTLFPGQPGLLQGAFDEGEILIHRVVQSAPRLFPTLLPKPLEFPLVIGHRLALLYGRVSDITLTKAMHINDKLFAHRFC
jgi:hypothetical protein